MQQLATAFYPPYDAAAELWRRRLFLVAGGLACAVAGMLVPAPAASQFFFALAGAVGGVGLMAYSLLLWRQRVVARAGRIIAAFVEGDVMPCLLTNEHGRVLRGNAEARRSFGAPAHVADALSADLADPQALCRRLRQRALAEGAVCEDAPLRGGLVRVTVSRLGARSLLWRIERIEAGPATMMGEAHRLARLSVASDDSVLYMNSAARRLIGRRVKSLSHLFTDLPLRPGTQHRLATAEGKIDCVVAVLPGAGTQREVFLLPSPAEPELATGNAFAVLPVPLLKVAPKGEIVAVNNDARRLLGAEVQPGARLQDLMEGLGRPIEDWLTAAAEDRHPQSEFLRFGHGEAEIFVQVTLRPIRERGHVQLLAVLSDATELKSLEAQFAQSQKMQAIGQLAGGVAHDFNNLLTAITGHCDLLLLRHARGDPDYADLVQINQNANRAAALVGQLLAFSRKQTMQPEALDLRATLSELAHLLNRLVGERVRLVLRQDPMLPPIWADKRQLEQVIMNLVVNARDAMPEGGEIRVETARLTLEEAMQRGRVKVPAGDYASVLVRDEGTGIPPDKLQKVFEPFYTTKRPGEGTGLGLSTVYGIVKQTGGYIFAESVRGEGTCFTLLLPLHNRPAAPLPKAPPAEVPATAAAQPRQGVVLLVEDEAPVRAFASRALRLRGHNVIEADSGEAALRILREDRPEIDVIVSDVVMPGMDGPTWVREAFEHCRRARIIFVSGYAEDSFGRAQTRIPQAKFLAKPFSLNDLTRVVQEQMEAAAQARAEGEEEGGEDRPSGGVISQARQAEADTDEGAG